MTNGSGAASCSIGKVTAAPGTRTVRVTYAGNGTYPANQLDTSVTVNAGNSDTLTYLGATTFTHNTSGTLKGKLTDSGTGNPIAGQTLTLALAPAGNNQDCSGTTAADGTFTCTIFRVDETPGSYNVRVSFAGGGGYPPNQLDTPVTVN